MNTTATPTSYTLYLDSCGDPGWCAPNGKSTIRFYVVAGLALTSVADMKADQEVNRLLTRYIPNAETQGFKREICYHHLIHGKDQYQNLEDTQRLAMANEIFDLLLQLKPVLFATVVDKIRMKERRIGISDSLLSERNRVIGLHRPQRTPKVTDSRS